MSVQGGWWQRRLGPLVLGKDERPWLWCESPPEDPPGNPEATPECSAYAGPCNIHRQHSDLAGELMVNDAEQGWCPFGYYYPCGAA